MHMKITALAIAALLATGTALAAAPNDTAKAPADTSATAAADSPDKPAKAHKKVKMSKKHHARHHAAKRHGTEMGAGAAPQTDLSDNGRQARMDEALAKYRQTHS
jgi:hypothetical protein